MQTKLSDFIKSSAKLELLTCTAESNFSNPLHTSISHTDYKGSYPALSFTSHSVRVNLELLGSRSYTRHFARSTFAPTQAPESSFARDATPNVVTVNSALHINRVNEEGEPILSSVEVFKNCIIDIEWDPKDEFFIAVRRSRFQLFGATPLLHSDQRTSNTTSSLLDLKAATVQTRLGAVNRISFGLSTVRFLGGTLNAICSYNGVAKVDVFDLEELDEETGDPLCCYELDSLFPDDEQNSSSSMTSSNSFPTATAITSVSDTLAIAALSNGCSVFLDTRTRKPFLCTRTANSPSIVITRGPQNNRAQRRKCNTAVSVVHCGCSTQIVTGSKNGLVELWDLRRCNQPVAGTAVSGSVEALICTSLLRSSRCGAPLVWLSTDSGDICCFSIGATSLEEISCIETKDTRRTHNSASLSPPRVSIMPQHGLLIYPFISLNRVLVYDIFDIEQSRMRNENKHPRVDRLLRDNLNVRPPAETGDFRNANILLRNQNSDSSESVSSLFKNNVKYRNPPLVQSLGFQEWSHQISCVSAAKKHSVVAVGGDDGDVHLLLDSC